MAAAAPGEGGMVPRPFRTLHVFGSRGCGKTSLKKQWFESAQSKVLSEIADVHIRIQKECSYSVMDNIRDSAGLDGAKHQAFIIVYRPDNKASIEYGESVLDKIYTSFDYTSQVEVIFIENHFEKEFRPHTEGPVEFPLSSGQLAVLASRNPPQLWRVVVTNSVQVSAALDTAITQPLLASFTIPHKYMLMVTACCEGRVQVLKLLAGTMTTDLNSAQLVLSTLASMEDCLAADPTHTATPTPAALRDVAYYLYCVDQTMVLSSIARSADKYPQASLRLLKEFCKQSSDPNHLVMTGAGLIAIPSQWVDHTHLTHIKLCNNLLTSAPVEMFQLPSLKGLNLSHNCLEQLPSVLTWNCPKLRDLDVSHNRLLSQPYMILEGKKNRGQALDHHPPSRGTQRDVIAAAQALLNLTGYNLYPCLCSVTRVSISHNPALKQIPEWVCVLPSLTLLEMRGLPRVTRLTPHLAHCRSLCLLQLDTQHLVSPPPNQAQQGTRNILAYLRCQLRGSTPYRHIKVVIVGEKGAGKSTLFRQFVRGSGSTSAMDMASFDYPSRIKVRKDRPRITFHVIDFAGDNIYRCTHNCFLTYRSIYLCLWNITGGKESLERLCPWLHSIQACVPGSPVLLVATHANRRPGLKGATILNWEEEVLGKPIQLKNKTTARRLGFPPIMQSIVMDCLSREDIDQLQNDLYNITLQMRHPQTNVLLMSDLLPRSYQELQTLIEVKVRNLCLERRVAPVMRHEELVDYVRSLTISNPHGLEHDREEFALACHFLHEAGAIIHYRSPVLGVSDLYFLDPQWLFNALEGVVRACRQGEERGGGLVEGGGRESSAVVSSGQWPHYFQSAGIPTSIYSSFLSMMESFNIIVSLDFEKNHFLLPSLLPDAPPPHYPSYDLAGDLSDIIVQYVELDYLPPPLFPQLIARVILHIRQLSGQLLSLTIDDSEGGGAMNSDPWTMNLDPGVRDSRASVASTVSTLRRRSQMFHVDEQGYLSQDDLNMAAQDETQRLMKLWGLSTANLSASACPDSRFKDLMQKLVAISQSMLAPQADSTLRNHSDDSSSHSDQFAEYVFWKKGLYCQFQCGTSFWLEASANALALVISGKLVPRVKVLSFLSSSIDALLDECYLGLKAISYSLCPTCLRNFWTADQRDLLTARESLFAVASYEQTDQVKINEFSESIIYLHRHDPEPVERSQSFSGRRFVLSTSPEPEPDSEDFADMPKVAMLDRNMTLFPLSATVQQSVMSSSIFCPNCRNRVPLETISPHVLLVDFKHTLLLKAKHLQFSEDSSSTLGKGGFGKVFRGTYQTEPVAVKVFRKGYHEDVMLRRYKDLREELSIMCQLQHPRVVALVGVCLKPLAMVLKLAPLGSLRDHIDLCPHGMQSHMAHQVLYQIADGIRYLHSLYIVHRDIKPSNVLVWSLDPTHGVDVKLADYGVSQFSSPSGLHRHKGTEEYMAPELFQDKRKAAYDEKVDVFSFGLVLHVVVTGRRLFPNIMNKREQLRLLYHSDFPQLSAALADALSDNKPLPSPSSSSQGVQVLPEGVEKHPAARRDVLLSCHSVCMQPLMESCLKNNPQDRPSAHGLCSSLLVCPGTHAQSDFYIAAPIISACHAPKRGVVVGIQGDRRDHLTLFPVESWEIKRCSTPYSGQMFSHVEVVEDEVFLAAEDLLLYSLKLPALQSGHISSTPLPSPPRCLFSCTGRQGTSIVVGLDAASIAIFRPPDNGGHLLNATPKSTTLLQHPDAQQKPVLCGLFYGRTLWCGCGRYLVGLDVEDLLIKHYKPIIKEDVEAVVMAAANDYVWVGFRDQSYLVICNALKPNDLETLDCHSILSKAHEPASKAAVTAITASTLALWVVTKGGHLLAFNPITADVLLVHRKKCSLSTLLCLSASKLITFGEGVVGEEQGEDSEETQLTTGMFTVWENYIQ